MVNSPEVLNIRARDLQKSSSLENDNSKGDIRDILRNGNFFKLFCCSIIMGTLYAEYGISLMINQKLGIDNIYLNGILLGVFESIGYTLIYFYADKLGRRQINIYSNAFVLMCATSLLLIGNMNSEGVFSKFVGKWINVIETGKLFSNLLISQTLKNKIFNNTFLYE